MKFFNFNFKHLFVLLAVLITCINTAWGDKATFTFDSGYTLSSGFNSNEGTGGEFTIDTETSLTNRNGGCLKVSLGGTTGNSCYLITKTPFSSITNVSYKFGASDKGKTKICIQISPKSDFSESVTTILESTALSNLTSASNSTLYDLSTDVSSVSGYVKILFSQQNSTKIGYFDDLVITYSSSGVTNPSFSPATGSSLVKSSGTVTLTSSENTVYYKWSQTDNQYAIGAGAALAGAKDGSGTSPVNATAPSTAGTWYLYAVAKDGGDYSNVVKATYTITNPTHTLTWNLDEGTATGGTAAGAVAEGETLTAPTVTKVGYDFAGWTPAVPATMPAADAAYTATWTKVYASGTYTFYGNTTVGSSPSKTVTTTATDYDAFRIDNLFFSSTNIQYESGSGSTESNDYYGWKVKKSSTIKFFVKDDSDVKICIGTIGGGTCTVSYTDHSSVAHNNTPISSGSHETYEVKGGTMVTLSMEPTSSKSVTLKQIMITPSVSCTAPTTTFGNGEYTADATPLDLSTLIGNNNSEGTITYSVTNANGTGATVTGSIFRASTAGTAYVRATQAADGDYCEAVLDATVTVSAHADRVFKTGDVIYFRGVNLRKTLGGNSVDKNWVSDGDGVYAYFYDDYVNEWQTSAGAYVSGSGATAVYKFTVPQHSGGDYSFTHVIFTRGTNSGWSNTHNQTWGYTARGDKNLFIINDSWTWDSSNSRNNHEGYWSKYTPSDSPALIGEFNSWNPDKGVFKDYVSNKGKVFMNLPANTTYQFRVLIEENEFGLNSAEPIDNTLGDWWKLYSGQGVLTMTTGEAGVYVFQWEKGSGKDYLGIYYPQARLKKGKYIYADLSKETGWDTHNPYDVKFVYKYYDSGDWKENGFCDHDTIKADADVFYTIVPDSTIGALSLVCLDDGNWATQYCESNAAWASTRSSSAPNCLKEEKDKENYENSWTPQWTTYCPPMTTPTLSDNSTTTYGGSGTEGSPYLVEVGTSINVQATGSSSSVPDPDMTAMYDFKVGGSTEQNTTATTFTYTASGTHNTTHAITVDAYNTYNETNSTKNTSSALYYKAVTIYDIAYKKGANGTGTEHTDKKIKGTNITLRGAIFTRTGYTQTGWATSDGGTKVHDLSATYSTDAALTLYPVWEAKTTTITLDPNTSAHGSSGDGAATATYDSGTLTSVTHTTPETGYHCIGYFTSSDEMIITAEWALVKNTTYTTNEETPKWKSELAELTLYAHYEPNTYTVTFVSNNDDYGTVSPTSIASVPHGSTVSINGSTNVLTLNGTNVTPTPASSTAQYTYAFDSWSVSSGTAITSAQTVTANFSQTPNSYSLTWNTNGGSDLAGTYTSGPTDYNASITAPTDPTLSNYTFDGWKTNNDGTGTAAAAKMPAATTTYYAAWKQTITLKTGSQGSGADITSAYVYLNGAAVNSYSAHDVSGCNLLGYYTAASAGTKVLNADGTFADDDVEDYITSGKWSRTGTTTLYAQWDAPLITWTLTTNSTSWSQASYTNNATYVTGGSISTTADENGGSKNSSATCRVDLASASDNVSKAASFSFEIYLGSKYIEPSKVECQVFNAGSGSGGDLSYKAQLTDEVGNEYYSTNTVVPENEAKLTDATFTFASDLVLRGEVTLKVYAWKSGSNGDAFRMGPAVKLYGTEKDHVCSAPAAPTITGASTYATGATITLTASCASGADALTTYTWYKGDNYGMALVNDAIQAAAKASEGGNVLTINTCDADDAGTYWCKASNSGTGVGCYANNSTGKMVMIADGYTITYNANGGSGSAPAAGKYVAGTTATVADKNTLSKSGYLFMGWNTANDGTGIFYGVGSTFAMPASNMTLYAQWGDCESCTAHVWYNKVPDGKSNTDRFTFPSGAPSGTNGSAETMTIDGTDYTSAKRSGDWAETFTFSVNTGCTGVLYFRIEGTGSNRVITITNTSTSATTTISGIGTGFNTYTSSSLAAGSYSVSVSANIHVALIALNECSPSGCTTYDVSFANMAGFGGTTTLPSTIEDVPTGSKIAQPASPVASGYKFDGWYSNAGCTAGNEINWSTMTITANKTIYAKWTDLSGKYTFHYGIGDPEDNSWVIVPFAQVGSTSKYQLDNFEIPDADEYPYFFVGYEGAFADHSHIYEWDATYTSLTKTYGQLPVAYANGYGSAIGNYALCASGKMAEGAKGTLHISSESTSDNYLLKFVPKGYALKWNGGTTELHATTNPKIFETNKVTLSSADVAGNFEVQIATSSSYVDCARTATEDVEDLNERKIEGETYSIANGTEGRFQIVVDEEDNFGLRFVPLINRSYGKYSINWTEDEYWTLGRRPNIDEDAYLNNSVYVNVREAQANKVIISKYGTHEGISGSTSNDGRLYVKPEGGLLIATTLKKLNSEGSEVANDNYFDVQIESDGTNGTGALITGSESANTQAYVQFYALARKDANGYLNQHFGIPTAQGSVYDFYNTYLYVFDRTLGASNENWYAASRKSSTMSPFTAYNLLRKESATGYYYMDGALNLPGKSGTKELICDDGDEDHDNNAAGDYMFANSWTAPIDIKAIEEEDFANAEATIYIFNAGSTYDEAHASSAAQDAEGAGQWVTLPVSAVEPLSEDLPLTVIPSMQGFLIKKTGTAATEAKLTLDYDKHVYTPAKDRAAGIEVKPARAPKHSNVNRPAVMKLYVDAESGNRDKLFILERADFSDAFDNGWDGRKILGESYAPQLYAFSADSKMSIDAISVIEGTVVGFRKGTNDEVYTISFNYDGDVQYYLNDLKEYVATPINEETEYTFTSAAEDAEARFIISKTPIHKTPTDISPTDGKQDAKVRKVLIDGHIYIIRGGRMYNATGALVK